MGKVKNEVAAGKSGGDKPAVKGKAKAPGMFASFFFSLLSADLYKPLQGKRARLWTAVALGVIVLVGVWRLYDGYDSLSIGGRAALALGTGSVLGWVIFRLINWAPFADFLIATEAEMNKVSWISKQDLKRSTAVVLTTVILLSILLFGVDIIWQLFLEFIGVMRIRSGGFGSTA
jgi:preprotein translocase subunit SecE